MKRLLLILLVAVIAFGVVAQDDTATVSPTLLENLDELEATVEDIRGLDVITPVDRRFPSKAEAADTIAGLLDEELTDDIVFEAMQFYTVFDFIAPDFNFREFYIELQQDQIAGFYNTDDKTMNTLLISGNPLGDDLPALEKTTYAHEFTHALQDQHFDLTMIEDIENGDHQLAVLSLVEGDATYVMQEYLLVLMEQNPGAIFEILSLSLSGDADLPEGTPPILESELLTPYLQGLTFVTALYSNGGWDAVNAAFTDLPQSTEQIIHPEKYLDGEAPIEVTLQPVDDVLGSDWTMTTEDTMGEFYLTEYLKTQLDTRTASEAAAGWGGDHYQVFYNTNADEQAYLLKITWDNIDEMADFMTTFEDFASRRMDTSAEDTCWLDSEIQDALCWQVLDETTLALSYAPDVTTAEALVNAQ